MPETWTFHSAGQLVFGPNACRQLGNIAVRLGVKKILVVTDHVLADAGPLSKVRGALAESAVSVEVFAGGEPEPSFGAADACVDAARRAHPDAMLGLGGGSNMDLAKIAATILTHGGTPPHYIGED